MLAPDFHRDRERSTAEEPNGRLSAGPARQRKIIHIDMDAFFASVEQRDNPELRGKPVAVGGSRERGVVAAASYEARTFGVRSAMPSVTAKRRCPGLIFVTPRFDVYKAVSLQIREIFAEYTPIIEPLSLDEAYLDVTENLKGIASATEIAEDIRATIRRETNLIGWGQLQQIPGEACLGSSQAGWPFCHYSENGADLCREFAGCQVSWHWTGNERENEPARDRNRPRSGGPILALPSTALR